MKKQVAILFGDQGGIGSATRTALLNNGLRIIPVNRNIIDFNTETTDADIKNLLTGAQSDIIINCTGVFVNGWQADHTETMNVNFGSNWSILSHYMDPKNQTKPTRIIMIGSSSYTSGRKLYPLYSASKAALFNLWQGVSDALADTPVKVDLINPMRTMTRMASANKSIQQDLPYLKPEQVAEQIVDLIKQNQPSRCIDMKFEDTK